MHRRRRAVAQAGARKVAQEQEAASPVREIAEQGTESGAGSLPFLDAVSEAFGEHDLSGVRAHQGTEASEANAALGSGAYAMGERVVLGDGADLHSVAHEAAHVVQQRSGAVPPGGVSSAGDAHERQADRVADAVVAGEDAGSLLGAPAAGGSGDAVQLDTGTPELEDESPDVGEAGEVVEGEAGQTTEDPADPEAPEAPVAYELPAIPGLPATVEVDKDGKLAVQTAEDLMLVQGRALTVPEVRIDVPVFGIPFLGLGISGYLEFSGSLAIEDVIVPQASLMLDTQAEQVRVQGAVETGVSGRVDVTGGISAGVNIGLVKGEAGLRATVSGEVVELPIAAELDVTGGAGVEAFALELATQPTTLDVLAQLQAYASLEAPLFKKKLSKEWTWDIIEKAWPVGIPGLSATVSGGPDGFSLSAGTAPPLVAESQPVTVEGDASEEFDGREEEIRADEDWDAAIEGRDAPADEPLPEPTEEEMAAARAAVEAGETEPTPVTDAAFLVRHPDEDPTEARLAAEDARLQQEWMDLRSRVAIPALEAKTVEVAPDEEVGEEAPAEAAEEVPAEAVEEAPAEAVEEVGEEAPVEAAEELPADVIGAHRVGESETLGSIAAAWYDDPKEYTRIAAYNRLADPNAIEIGQVLLIPREQAEVPDVLPDVASVPEGDVAVDPDPVEQVAAAHDLDVPADTTSWWDAWSEGAAEVADTALGWLRGALGLGEESPDTAQESEAGAEQDPVDERSPEEIAAELPEFDEVITLTIADGKAADTRCKYESWKKGQEAMIDMDAVKKGSDDAVVFKCSTFSIWTLAKAGFDVDQVMKGPADGEPYRYLEYKSWDAKTGERTMDIKLFMLLNGQPEAVTAMGKILAGPNPDKGQTVDIRGEDDVMLNKNGKTRAKGHEHEDVVGEDGDSEAIQTGAIFDLAGIGEAVDATEIRPGDFGQLWREGPDGHAFQVHAIVARGAAWFGSEKSPVATDGEERTGWHEDVEMRIDGYTDPWLCGELGGVNHHDRIEATNVGNDAVRVNEDPWEADGQRVYFGRLDINPWTSWAPVAADVAEARASEPRSA